MGTAVGDQWLSVCNNAPLVRNQFGLRISRSRSPQPVPLDNQNVLGTICPWGLNFGGPFVQGINWGPILWGPNVWGRYEFGTKFYLLS